MKLIVQIPCLNEEHTLPQTLRDIPRQIDGIDSIEILVIDDGSSDRTVEVAREFGVDHVVRNKTNIGLARSFRAGLDASLRAGADVIVNTDGDNQYSGADIAKLVQPILAGRADIVIGDRQTSGIGHFSWRKKLLQKVGSRVVRILSEVDVPDAVSGFRAISRDAALQINIVSPFSYTIEMLIQVGKKHIAYESVPIATNLTTRDSRLFSSIGKFMERSVTTMVRMYTMFQPLRVFTLIGGFIVLLGAAPVVRFLYLFLIGEAGGHIQSLVIGGSLLVVGVVTLLIGLLADLINYNRQLIEMILERVRRIELAGTSEDGGKEEGASANSAAPSAGPTAKIDL